MSQQAPVCAEGLWTGAVAAVGPAAVCWAGNNECIMWNGFLPHCEPVEQSSHKQGFVL